MVHRREKQYIQKHIVLESTTMHDLEGLAEFAAVAEARGFTAAARRLGTTKSVLSNRIRRIERRLAVRLFDRTTRRLAMTEAGQLYYRHARRILDEAGAAEEALQRLKGEPRGHLRVATTVNFACLFLAETLPAFRRRFPSITIEIVAEEAVIDPIARGVDVAVRFSAEATAGTIARKVASVDYVLCAAPAYLAAHGTPHKPADLAKYEGLSPRDEGAQSTWQLRRRKQVVRVTVPTPVRTANGTLVRALALAGNGIATLNRLAVARELKSGELVQVLPGWQVEGSGAAMWIVLPDNRAIPPKVRVFIDFVVDGMAKWEGG